MMDYTKKIIKDIKDIKIQGASNIVYSCFDAFEKEVLAFKTGSHVKYFDQIVKEFWSSRPTEPAMKHFLTSFMIQIDVKGKYSVLKPVLLEFIKNSRIEQEEAIGKISDRFVRDLRQKTIIFTHCHSSIVEECIKKAHKYGLLKFVVNTETRPLYQGRTTALSLAKAGIEVKHIVDSAVFAFAKNLSHEHPAKDMLFVTGADVITNKGDLINKIGTKQISVLMDRMGIRHYVVTTNSKIDVIDKNWTLEKVEIRDPKEIWDVSNKNIEVINYVFDVTPFSLINRLYTENGVGKPQSMVLKHKVTEDYVEIWKKLDKIKP